MEDNLNKRYQTLLILWFALLVSINQPGTSSRSLLIVALTALGTFLVVVSFPVKQRLLERAVEKQDTALVQKALVIACAMCEVSALLGLLEHLVIGNREYYLLFVMAAGGTAFHFPRRS